MINSAVVDLGELNLILVVAEKGLGTF